MLKPDCLPILGPPSHHSENATRYSGEQFFNGILFDPTNILCAHAQVSSITDLQYIHSTLVSHHDRRHGTDRISARFSHVCETNRPLPLSPNAHANFSTQCNISCVNRRAVPFASIIVYVRVNFNNIYAENQCNLPLRVV
jgi:hypothetical protein